MSCVLDFNCVLDCACDGVLGWDLIWVCDWVYSGEGAVTRSDSREFDTHFRAEVSLGWELRPETEADET